jgi:hypothetical protein
VPSSWGLSPLGLLRPTRREGPAALVKFLGILSFRHLLTRRSENPASGTRQCCPGYLGAYGKWDHNRCGCPVYHYTGAPSYSEAVNPSPAVNKRESLGCVLRPSSYVSS